MFLNVLAAESKPKFLSLIKHAAAADGEISEAELLHIGAYAKEMGVAFTDVDPEPLDQVVAHFASQSEIVRNAVFAEVSALAQVDQQFHLADEEFLDALGKSFSLTQSFQHNIKDWINQITPLYAQGFKLVGLV